MWRGLGLLTVLSPLLNVLSLAECIDFNSRQGIGDWVVGSANIECKMRNKMELELSVKRAVACFGRVSFFQKL